MHSGQFEATIQVLRNNISSSFSEALNQFRQEIKGFRRALKPASHSTLKSPLLVTDSLLELASGLECYFYLEQHTRAALDNLTRKYMGQDSYPELRLFLMEKIDQDPGVGNLYLYLANRFVTVQPVRGALNGHSVDPVSLSAPPSVDEFMQKRLAELEQQGMEIGPDQTADILREYLSDIMGLSEEQIKQIEEEGPDSVGSPSPVEPAVSSGQTPHSLHSGEHDAVDHNRLNPASGQMGG